MDEIEAVGSPPHTRGKDADDGLAVAPLGITPAHAGKRPRETPGSPRPRDHPRTRGEKDMQEIKATTEEGSPPHTRGKGRSSAEWEAVSGITPAHAGKSATN